jgi:prepilin-type N-terminal cleavage/methylation domain-containing protein
MEVCSQPILVRSRSGGFTLVETIVALGIVALLTAITFGAFAPAREGGRRTVCVSNLNQFGKAFTMYAHDWDGQDARPGITWYGAGLPPGNSDSQQAFLKEYKLWNSPVQYCPDFRPNEATGRLSTSYVVPVFGYSDAEGLQNLLARKGGDAPLMYCWWHYSTTDFNKLPSWTQLHIPILRANFQVSVKKSTVSTMTTSQL